MQNDPRAGLPSASAFSRYAHCYGSYLAEKGVPEPECRDEYAEHGDAIHRALKGDKVELTDEQRETFEMCHRLERQFMSNYPEASQCYREQRYWLVTTTEGLKRVMSGQVDSLWINDDQSLAWIVDFKTLFGEHEKADENIQLMVLAVLLDGARGKFESITVALVQPWAKGQITVAKYDRPALDAARKEVLRILGEINKPDAPRTPGKWCQHCRACPTCPEANGQMWALSVATNSILSQPEKIGAYYLMWKQIEKRGDQLEKLVKSILTKDPNAIPGLKLEEGNERREVTNVITAWRHLYPYAITDSEFSALLKFNFGDAETLIKEKLALKSKKEAKDKLNEILGDVIVKKQNAPSIAIDKSADVDLIP